MHVQCSVQVCYNPPPWMDSDSELTEGGMMMTGGGEESSGFKVLL